MESSGQLKQISWFHKSFLKAEVEVEEDSMGIVVVVVVDLIIITRISRLVMW